MNFKGKHILLGITAGIAAYKTCELVRKYQKAGAQVTVVMTPNAEKFVSPLVLASLSKNKVYCEQFNYENYDIEHISLAQKADIFVIAPATANTISKIAHGICDNLLTSVVCAFDKPILIVPAMNVNMYENILIQENLAKLNSLNYKILPPEEGELACGVVAKGRMAELDKIVEKTAEIIAANSINKKVVITAGGTRENLDPVRYIGNYSSGKMGLALADEAYKLGCEVVLISTFDVQKPYKVLTVNCADEMLSTVKDEFINADCLIMAAAVADFKPVNISAQKIKKDSKDIFTIEMVKNPDILREISKIKRDNQIVVGFCAESENLLENAVKKLNEKNLDFIAANDISRSDIGFGSDFNEIILFDKSGAKKIIERTTKNEAAKLILAYCLK